MVGGVEPDLFLGAMGRFVSRGGFVYRQVSNWVALHVIMEGRGTVAVEGRSFTVGAGELFTFFPGQLINYHDDVEQPWRYTWFTLRGAHAEEVLAHCGLDRVHPVRSVAVREELESVFRDVESEYSRTTVSPTAAIVLAWRMVRALEPQNAPSSRPSLGERARLLFDHHYGEPLTVDEVAQKLRVSRATLFRAFRAEHGVSPKQFLDGLRLERAMRLLRASDQSVKEIASGCGYGSESYFSRVFKQQTGQPPGQWRRNA